MINVREARDITKDYLEKILKEDPESKEILDKLEDRIIEEAKKGESSVVFEFPDDIRVVKFGWLCPLEAVLKEYFSLLGFRTYTLLWSHSKKGREIIKIVWNEN